ncbi:MAG: hypothetical protein WC070_03225 [Candidatus Magasanikbacteria bacterium]
MREPNYREALSKGWHLAWHNKSLWVFGLFAAFLGQMGIFEYVLQAFISAEKIQSPSVWFYVKNMLVGFNFGDFINLFHTSLDKQIWLVWLIIILLAAFSAFIFVSVVSQGAIVHNTAQSLGLLKIKLVETDESWHESRRHFWKLLFLNIFKKLFTLLFLSFIVWGIWNVSLEASMSSMLLFLVIFLLASIVGMILSLWLIYAVSYVVIEDEKLWVAMRKAWRLFTKHWFVSLEIGFIFIILNIFLALLILAGLYILFLPSLFFWTMLALTGNITFYALGLVLGFILFSLYVMLLGSIFVVFSTSTWTYLFIKMHKTGLKSHLVKLFHS